MKFVVTIAVATMAMLSCAPFVGGKDAAKATVGVGATTTKQKQKQQQQKLPNEDRFRILIVCQKDHEDECKNEIESVEDVHIVNHMIYTPNMFVMEVWDDDNEAVDEDSIMADLQALPHVKEVEEDIILRFNDQYDTTNTFHVVEEKLEQLSLKQNTDVLDKFTAINHHELTKKFKEAYHKQRGGGDDDDGGDDNRRRGLRRDSSSSNASKNQKKKKQQQEERQQRVLSHLGQEIPYGIYQTNAPEMWEEYDTKGAGVKVCVIDSGVSNTHEDLDSTKLSGTGGTTSLPKEWFADSVGHGTHVAGTIAAADNSVGVVGVAPEAEIHAINISTGIGLGVDLSLLISALDECENVGASVINMSFGTPSYNNQVRLKVEELMENGLILVAAAGNDGGTSSSVAFPAAYDGVLSVSAADELGYYTDFTTFNTEVDITGPGEDVLSLSSKDSNLYFTESGTSQASPHVAGCVALLKSAFPKATANEILEALKNSAIGKGECGRDARYGHGHIDVKRAADYLSLNKGVVGTSASSASCQDVEISISTDARGNETIWDIFKVFGDPDDEYLLVPIATGGPFQYGLETTVVADVGVPNDGCYAFAIYDWGGDGLDGDGSYTVKFGEFSFTSSFDLDVDLVQSGEANNYEIIILGCEDTFDMNLPAFGDNNLGFKRRDLFSTPGIGNNNDCAKDGEVLVTLSGRMDRFSEDENGLALIDSEYELDFLSGERVPTEMFVGKGGFSNNEKLSNMRACLDLTKCYIFYFFDSNNDGLTSLDSNGLTMSVKSPIAGIQVEFFTMPPDTGPNLYYVAVDWLVYATTLFNCGGI